MAVSAGQKVRIFIETQEGTVYDITGDVSSMAISQSFDDFTQVDLSIVGNMPLTMIRGGKTHETTATFWDRGEWKCSYCGHVNPRSARVCGGGDNQANGCGAARSFIYD